MADKYDISFNSEADSPKTLYQLASGHVSLTRVLFEKENIYAVIDANGSAEFFDADGEKIADGCVVREDGGRSLYEQIRFSVSEDLLTLEFPICEWIDNYPNCDGEHDRWDTRIIGYREIKLDLAAKKVI